MRATYTQRDPERKKRKYKFIFIATVLMAASLLFQPTASPAEIGYGVNLIRTAEAPLDSEAYAQSLKQLQTTGATKVALIPFLYQNNENTPKVVLGSDFTLAELEAGIVTAKQMGFSVSVKPHIWVPTSWAGAIRTEAGRPTKVWGINYRAAILAYADVAQRAGADAFFLGTEIREMTKALPADYWQQLIVDVRDRFKGQVGYAAKDVEEAERLSFVDQLDFLGVTLYPEIPAEQATDAAAIEALYRERLSRLQKLSEQQDDLPIWIAEIGLMSAEDAHLQPWLSPEQRTAPYDGALQAAVLKSWFTQATYYPSIDSILIWRWFSDPSKGGSEDIDFTIQNKQAEQMLACHINKECP